MKKRKREISTKELMELAQKASQRAWNENFALGLPIVIEENGNIVKKYKDGRVELVKKLNKKKS